MAILSYEYGLNLKIKKKKVYSKMLIRGRIGICKLVGDMYFVK